MKMPVFAIALMVLAGPAFAQVPSTAQPQGPSAQTDTSMPMRQMMGGGMRHESMPGRMMGRFSPEDMSAFIDAHIAAVHAGLKLSAAQEKMWPPVEDAMRSLARLHLSHMQTMRQAQGMMASDPVGHLRAMADHMSQGADAMRKLADAAAPLYATLDEAQKRRLQVLVRPGPRGVMGGRMMRGWSDSDDDDDDR